MQTIERRDFLKTAGLGAFAFVVGDATVMLTPREAFAQAVPPRVLTQDEAETLGALGETLVPGAREAGITQFVDQQLSLPPGDALLTARIVNIWPPYVGFYRAGLGAIERASQVLHGRRFAQLAQADQRAFVDRMRQNKIDDWKGPPGSFLFFVTRSDAVDVVYGTMDGFKRLNIPYMAHIEPERKW